MKIKDLQDGSPRLVKRLHEHEEEYAQEYARTRYNGFIPPVYEKQMKSKLKRTTTKPGKHKNHQQLAAEQEEQARKEQEYFEMRRGPTQTRSQANFRMPPKWDLSRLEGIDDDELIRALKEDPEYSGKGKTSESKERPKSKLYGKRSGGKRYYRAADGTVVSEYPEHVRELMDSGVPIMQWVILFALLGAGLLQLRKSLVGPEKKKIGTGPAGRNKTRGTEIKGKQKMQKKKSEGPKVKKPTVPKKAAKPSPKPKQITKSEPAIETKEQNSETVEPDAKATKQKTKKKKKSQNGASAKKDGKQKQKQPDNVSTEGSPIQNDGENDKNAPVALTPPIHAEPPAVNDDDGGGWHAVTKSRKASTPAAESPKSTPPTSSQQPKHVSQVSEKPSGAALAYEPEPTDSHAEKENLDVGFTKATNKKNKKKKRQPAPQASNPTDDDAALARKLQKEEEILANADTETATEEVWEEVTSKKKKGH